MGFYREKPKEVEARLFDGDTPALMDVVEWVKGKGYTWSDPFTPLGAKGITIDPGTGFLGVATNGEMTYASRGDWVYCDVDGTIKVGKAGEFEASYEPVADPVPVATPEPDPAQLPPTEASGVENV